MKISVKVIIGIFCFLHLANAVAGAASFKGKVRQLEGHITAACRMLFVQADSDASVKAFRIPDTGVDNSILAVAMMAFSQNRSVIIVYTEGATTGCGTEPKVDILQVAPNEDCLWDLGTGSRCFRSR